MTNVIILHGMPSKEEYMDPAAPAQSNLHWIPWVQRQLILRGVLAQTPELPEPYAPVYETWREVFEQFEINEETILIGHSCGAGFLVRWLTETRQRVGKVALVAPFLDPDHDEVASDFFAFTVGQDMAATTAGMRVFYASEDDQEILDSVEQLKHLPGVDVTCLNGRGHFVESDMGTEAFPELVAWVTGNT